VSQETWDTADKIANAMQRFGDRMHGWRAPAAYGVVLVPQSCLGTSSVRFPVVNVPVHGLPAMVMGLITGRRSETGTYDLSPSELNAAIALLAPAEAARMFNHPNLLAWRKIAADWRGAPLAQAFVVFVADFSHDVTSSYDEALRRQIQSGDRSAEIRAVEHN
jgi:hypothetical protein